MSTKKSKIKIFSIIIVLLLLIISVSSVVWSAEPNYKGVAGIETVVNSENSTDMLNKTIHLGFGELKSSDYLYCLENGQTIWTEGSNYRISVLIEINGETATAKYIDSNENIITSTNNNMYNAILALILNAEEAIEGEGVGHGEVGENGDDGTTAQKTVWEYFPYWITNSAANANGGLGIDSSWCSANKTSIDANNTSINAAEQKYANGNRASATIYLLKDDNTQHSWQNLMIAIPEGVTEPKDLIIEKVDETTGEKLGGVEFILWNDENKFIQASGPDGNNIYTFTGYTENGNEATKLKTGTIDGYKSITIENLPEDIYSLREMYNPNIAYVQNEGRIWEKEIEIDYDIEANQIVFEAKNESGDIPEDKNTSTTVIGKVTISGFVWEDIASGKDNSVDSQYNESTEQKLAGIKVYWKDANGGVIEETTTAEDGSYKFSMELKFKNHPYELIDIDKYNLVKDSYVEFDYNGLKYTTVANASDITKENLSQGKEVEADRDVVDAKFDMVASKNIIDITENGENKTSIEDENTIKNLIEPNYSENFAVTATTNEIKNMLTIAENQDGWTAKTMFCTEHCTKGYREHEVGRIELNKDGASATIVVYCFGKPKVENWNDIEGKLTDEINSYMEAPLGEEFNNENYNAQYYSANEVDGPALKDCLSGEEKIYEWNIKNVNLGLVLREQPQVALDADIEKVRVIMNGQEYIYIYGKKGLEGEYDCQVQFENKYVIEQYSRPVNPADIAYVNTVDPNALKVYVTYNILAINRSNSLYIETQNVVNYYDSNYTIYTGEGSATSEGWKDVGTVNGYKAAYNDSFKGIKIKPQATTELLKIEFEVGQNIVKELQNKDALLRNVSEIVSYTTYYGENTMCAEREEAKVKDKVGQQYAGLDKDSIPENAIPGNHETYEADTAEAPRFLLLKDEYKMMSGTVWEDTQTAESKNKNERLGDGVKSEAEKGVENVKVELLEANEDGTIKLDANGNAIVAKLYRIENGESISSLAVTYTNQDGYFSFGNNNSNTQEGVVTDYYVIRYTYGDNTKISGTTINGRNYKSTIITTEPIKSIMKGTSNNDKWHLTVPDNGSVAIDDLNDRLKISSLNYSNFDETVTISAYSKPFKLQLEYTAEQQKEVEADGETIQNSTEKLPDDYAVFDFGIIERPREDIIIDKTISHVRLTLGDTGQELINGNPQVDEMDYVKKMGFHNVVNSREIFNQRKKTGNDDKVLTMEIDSETLLGSTLEVTYEITVTNNSEIDYEYSEDSQYYYYGENPTHQIKESVEYVVDYLDSEVVMRKDEGYEHNNVWEVISGGNIDEVATQLKDAGLISYKLNDEDTNKTYEAIRQGGYTIFKTNAFANLARGTSQTEKLSISKELANQDDQESVFENHVEILQLNGKIARTIDSVKDDTREQVIKTYKPGNYMPNLANRIYDDNGTLVKSGLHQQDDDRVRIVITPPTGTTNYITSYIITIAIGLIVMIGGIIFIKKKVINK